MKVVLYTEDFEPITVFDLPVMPEQIVRFLGSRYRVAIHEPPQFRRSGESWPDPAAYQTLTIRLEPLHWLHGELKWVFIAEDEVLALRLRAAWLPGQQRQINEYRQTIDLFAAALLRAMGLG